MQLHSVANSIDNDTETNGDPHDNKRYSYLKAGFEAGAKAEAEAKTVARQKNVFIFNCKVGRIVSAEGERWCLRLATS